MLFHGNRGQFLMGSMLRKGVDLDPVRGGEDLKVFGRRKNVAAYTLEFKSV